MHPNIGAENLIGAESNGGRHKLHQKSGGQIDYPSGYTNGGYNKTIDQKLLNQSSLGFWILIILLFIFTVGNLMLTMTIVGVLKISRGMQTIEFVPDANTIKFFGDVEFDRIRKDDGMIEGFLDTPIEISGDSGPVMVNLLNRTGHTNNKLLLNSTGIYVSHVNHFDVKDSNGNLIFNTKRPVYNISKPVQRLHAKVLNTNRITSPANQSLRIDAKGKIHSRGAEGTTIRGKNLEFWADQNVGFHTSGGSISIISHNGVYLDTKSIPIMHAEHGIRAGNVQYKLCICMPKGKIFKMEVPKMHMAKISCADYDPEFDPCV